MKVHLDMEAITLGDMVDASELLGESVSVALAGANREKGLLALACITVRHDQPDFTWEQARALRMSDLEVENAPEGEVNAVNNGDGPALLPATGA